MVTATTAVPATEDGQGTAQAGTAPRELIRALGSSRLRRRRFEAIPLRGPGAAYSEAQGRQPGDASTPQELADLISSIAEIGVLQPILVEEIGVAQGPARMRVVAGERRLRACRWGAAHLQGNEHFAAIPAIVCPGPLSDEERRIWQLIENLAREPLRPGEQAAALLLHRCAILTGKLLKAGRPVPAEVYDLDDPVARFAALEKIRGTDAACAAPWSEVLMRLGLQLSPRKARELARAFAALPRHLSDEMDEAKITLHTRIRFAQLRQGRDQAAEQIWAAVKSRNRTDLLAAAVTATLSRPETTADQALAVADELHQAANRSRAAKLARTPQAEPTPLPIEPADEDKERSPEPRSISSVDVRRGHAVVGHRDVPSAAADHPGTWGPAAEQCASANDADSGIVRAAVEGLRALTAELRAGRRLARYDAGSVQLALEEAGQLLEERSR